MSQTDHQTGEKGVVCNWGTVIYIKFSKTFTSLLLHRFRNLLDLYKNNPPRVWSRIGVELLLDSGAITPIGKSLFILYKFILQLQNSKTYKKV